MKKGNTYTKKSNNKIVPPKGRPSSKGDILGRKYKDKKK